MLARTAEAKSPVPIKVIMKVKINKANPAKWNRNRHIHIRKAKKQNITVLPLCSDQT